MSTQQKVWYALAAIFATILFAVDIQQMFFTPTVDKPYQGGNFSKDVSATMPVKFGPADIYPPVPGAVNPAITQDNIDQNICNPKWSTKSERPSSAYTTKLKIKQMQDYDLPGSTKDYEEDHLISLELGGNPTDPNNLWPEGYTASVADGGAKTKDKVENYLHAQVCSGAITLAEAQSEISTDWYLVYVNDLKFIFGGVTGIPDTDPDDEQ